MIPDTPRHPSEAPITAFQWRLTRIVSTSAIGLGTVYCLYLAQHPSDHWAYGYVLPILATLGGVVLWEVLPLWRLELWLRFEDSVGWNRPITDPGPSFDWNGRFCDPSDSLIPAVVLLLAVMRWFYHPQATASGHIPVLIPAWTCLMVALAFTTYREVQERQTGFFHVSQREMIFHWLLVLVLASYFPVGHPLGLQQWLTMTGIAVACVLQVSKGPKMNERIEKRWCRLLRRWQDRMHRLVP